MWGCRDPAGGGVWCGLWRSVRHPGGVRELSGGSRCAGAAGERAQARPCGGPRRDALSAGADRAAGRRAAAAARPPGRPVRSRHRRGHRAAPDPAADGSGRRRDASARQPGDPGRGRALDHPRGLQRHGAGSHARPTLPALFAAQAARTPDAVAVVFEDRSPDLCGARRARQPPGQPPARARRRARARGGALRRALARDGGGAARHPQGRRRLPAARSELPARAARLHAVGRRRPGAGDAAGAARPAAG